MHPGDDHSWRATRAPTPVEGARDNGMQGLLGITSREKEKERERWNMDLIFIRELLKPCQQQPSDSSP